jgi:hypothetical protein
VATVHFPQDKAKEILEAVKSILNIKHDLSQSAFAIEKFLI